MKLRLLIYTILVGIPCLIAWGILTAFSVVLHGLLILIVAGSRRFYGNP